MRPIKMLSAAGSDMLAGCGGVDDDPSYQGARAGHRSPRAPKAAEKLGFPAVATKNTTRVAGGDPIADAAGVALAVYPSSGAGTHPRR